MENKDRYIDMLDFVPSYLYRMVYIGIMSL